MGQAASGPERPSSKARDPAADVRRALETLRAQHDDPTIAPPVMLDVLQAAQRSQEALSELLATLLSDAPVGPESQDSPMALWFRSAAAMRTPAAVGATLRWLDLLLTSTARPPSGPPRADADPDADPEADPLGAAMEDALRVAPAVVARCTECGGAALLAHVLTVQAESPAPPQDTLLAASTAARLSTVASFAAELAGLGAVPLLAHLSTRDSVAGQRWALRGLQHLVVAAPASAEQLLDPAVTNVLARGLLGTPRCHDALAILALASDVAGVGITLTASDLAGIAEVPTADPEPSSAAEALTSEAARVLAAATHPATGDAEAEIIGAGLSDATAAFIAGNAPRLQVDPGGATRIVAYRVLVAGRSALTALTDATSAVPPLELLAEHCAGAAWPGDACVAWADLFDAALDAGDAVVDAVCSAGGLGALLALAGAAAGANAADGDRAVELLVALCGSSEPRRRVLAGSPQLHAVMAACSGGQDGRAPGPAVVPLLRQVLGPALQEAGWGDPVTALYSDLCAVLNDPPPLDPSQHPDPAAAEHTAEVVAAAAGIVAERALPLRPLLSVAAVVGLQHQRWDAAVAHSAAHLLRVLSRDGAAAAEIREATADRTRGPTAEDRLRAAACRVSHEEATARDAAAAEERREAARLRALWGDGARLIGRWYDRRSKLEARAMADLGSLGASLLTEHAWALMAVLEATEEALREWLQDTALFTVRCCMEHHAVQRPEVARRRELAAAAQEGARLMDFKFRQRIAAVAQKTSSLVQMQFVQDALRLRLEAAEDEAFTACCVLFASASLQRAAEDGRRDIIVAAGAARAALNTACAQHLLDAAVREEARRRDALTRAQLKWHHRCATFSLLLQLQSDEEGVRRHVAYEATAFRRELALRRGAVVRRVLELREWDTRQVYVRHLVNYWGAVATRTRSLALQAAEERGRAAVRLQCHKAVRMLREALAATLPAVLQCTEARERVLLENSVAVQCRLRTMDHRLLTLVHTERQRRNALSLQALVMARNMALPLHCLQLAVEEHAQVEAALAARAAVWVEQWRARGELTAGCAVGAEALHRGEVLRAERRELSRIATLYLTATHEQRSDPSRRSLFW